MRIVDYKYLDSENCFKVVFDDGTKILVDYLIFEKYQLHLDMEVDEDIFEEIKFFSSVEIAKKRALIYLSKRMKTKREVERKLLELGFTYEVSVETVNFLEYNHFLNDREYAENFIDEKVKLNGYGINKIRALLLQRGINEEVFRDILEDIDLEDEFNRAMEFATKKLRLIDTDDKYKIKQKLFSYLSYKGFKFDVIDSVLREIL